MKRLLLAGLLALGTVSAIQACPEADNVYYGEETTVGYDTETGVPVPLSTYDSMDSIAADAVAPYTTTLNESGMDDVMTAMDDTSLIDATPTLTALNTEVMSGPGTALRIVGRITGDTNRMTSRKLHVSSNGYGWTINAPDNVLSVDMGGDKMSVHDLHEGDWVVAEGTKIGSSRIRALAIRKLGDDMSGYQQSAFYQPMLGSGYAMSITAGPDFRTQARESILGVRSQVAGERQEIYDMPKD